VLFVNAMLAVMLAATTGGVLLLLLLLDVLSAEQLLQLRTDPHTKKTLLSLLIASM